MERLKKLLEGRHKDLNAWPIGKVPKHYKRLTCSEKDARDLAILGYSIIGGAFDEDLYFTQSLIAGAIFSGQYDTITVVTPSQYGKSWLLGRIALIMAVNGSPTYVAAATQDRTNIIMGHLIKATQDVSGDIRAQLIGVDVDKLERLGKSLSKQRISTGAGFVEALTLGDSYGGSVSKNRAVGRGGDYIVDEAALCSEETMQELGRRDFAKLGDDKYKLIMISNPHNRGFFYDHLTKEDPGERDFILWADALTAVEEERFTAEQVLGSEFAQHASTRKRYLLCELEDSGAGMFSAPKVAQPEGKPLNYFMGIDAAYKGKDNIEAAIVGLYPDGTLHVEEVETIQKGEWIDGITSEDIIRRISAIVGAYKVALTCVDTGFGVWLTEGLAKRAIHVKGVNFGAGASKKKYYASVNASNKRAEMHLSLQELMEQGQITWQEEAADSVTEALNVTTYERTASGKVKIRPKAEIKALIGHSPDKLDAVLLAVHAAVLSADGYSEFITD